MKKQGLMPERPFDAFPLKSQVHRGEARDEADRASLDATLKGLGYMAATRPGNADRESALRRVAWQVTNRNYEGLVPGSDLHKRLSEFATAKIIEQRMAASDGSIAAGRAPGEFREAIRREKAPATPEGFDPMQPYKGYPAGTPQEVIDNNRNASKAGTDPFDVGISGIGAAAPQAAPNEVRLEILGIGTGKLRGANDPTVAGILGDIERLPELGKEQVEDLMRRISALEAKNSGYRSLSRQLILVLERVADDGERLPPMLSDDELREELGDAVGRKEAAKVVAAAAGAARRLAKEFPLRNPYSIALQAVLIVVQGGATVAGHIYSRRERRYLLEIARREARALINGDASQR